MKVKKLLKKTWGTIPVDFIMISDDEESGVFVPVAIESIFGDRKVKRIRAKEYLGEPIIEITIKGRLRE